MKGREKSRLKGKSKGGRGISDRRFEMNPVIWLFRTFGDGSEKPNIKV